MTEEISARLGEIVDLLRQRLALEEHARERNEEQRKRSEIALARLQEERPKLPDFTEFRKAGLGPEHDERMKRIEERAEEDRQERREFNQRLLAELERHNKVLEEILARV